MGATASGGRGDGPTATCLWAIAACEPATLTYRITDVLTGTDVSFRRLSRSDVAFRGRMVGDRRARVHGTLPDGSRGLLSEQVHSPRVLHAAIREPAAALGWQEKQPRSATIGMVVAITAGVGLVVAGLVVGCSRSPAAWADPLGGSPQPRPRDEHAAADAAGRPSPLRAPAAGAAGRTRCPPGRPARSS